MTGVVAADNKHAGISILRRSNMTEPGQVGLSGGLIVGQSDPYVCGLCVNRRDGGAMDPGCAPKMVMKGNNKNSPFTPARGLVSSVFATAFVPGESGAVLWGCAVFARAAAGAFDLPGASSHLRLLPSAPLCQARSTTPGTTPTATSLCWAS